MQTTTKKKFDRDSELRIRNVSPTVKKELEELRKLLKKPFDSYVIEFLVMRYRQDQEKLKDLTSKRYQLEGRVASLEARESAVKDLLSSFVSRTVRFNKMVLSEAAKLQKRFSGTVKRKKPGAAGQARSKSVPRKKAAKKRGGKK